MGPVLVEEYPYAHVVSNEHAVNVCAHCMHSSKKPLSRCSRCRFAHYCGAQCQKDGWTEHKEECLFLVKVQPRVPTAMARLLARVISKRGREDIAPAFNGRTFDSLLSHSDEIKKDAEKSEFFVTLSHVLYEYMGGDNLPSPSELLDVFGKVMVNVFTISNDDLNTIGLGLYLGLSVLDHSCDPDAFVLFDGTKAILRPLKQAITAYDESLRISYCDLLDLTAMRQNQLKQQFFFICDCTTCSDLEREKTARSVRCRTCVGGYCPLDANDNSLVCWQCGATCDVHVDDAVRLMQQIEWETKRLQEKGNESLSNAKDLYNEASTVLSSLNIPLCQLADQIVSQAIANENFTLAADYIEKTVSCFKRFYPMCHPALSLQYFKAGKLHSLSDITLDLAAERLEQAVGYLHSSHGVQHRLSVQAHELLSKVQQQRRDIRNRQVKFVP
ncbi:unnamed protein product [Toxocara canis]|uniref:MYND-type domain-containing protein n=1 Tax=Toxocara canis TaxID=6265 RepID=A0A183UD51_TOXCA|nr:unnamed protein product [Toxocara canis]